MRLKREGIMNITITEIEIGFENVEVVNIPPEYIMELRIWGMKDWRLIHRNDEEIGGNNELVLFLKRKKAEGVFMKIDKVAKGKIMTSVANFITGCENELFWRIMRYPDIVDLKIKYSDGTEEEIDVDWEDGNKGGEINALQKNAFDDEENLVIKIGKMRS